MSFSYERFESYFRGNEKAIEGRKEEFRALIGAVRELLTTGGVWLDIGAGRGSLLDEARMLDFDTHAIESNQALADECLKKGHATICSEQAQAIAMLTSEGRRFDIISVLHVIEHLKPEDAATLITGCVQLLRPGGLLVLETPNAADTRVMLGSFYRDPTHVRPYPKLLLEFMLEDAGLTVVKSYAFDRVADDRAKRGAYSAPYGELRKRIDSVIAGLRTKEGS